MRAVGWERNRAVRTRHTGLATRHGQTTAARFPYRRCAYGTRADLRFDGSGEDARGTLGSGNSPYAASCRMTSSWNPRPIQFALAAGQRPMAKVTAAPTAGTSLPRDWPGPNHLKGFRPWLASNTLHQLLTVCQRRVGE